MADKKYHPGLKYEIPHFLSPDTGHLCSHVLFLMKNNQISWESTPENISSF